MNVILADIAETYSTNDFFAALGVTWSPSKYKQSNSKSKTSPSLASGDLIIESQRNNALTSLAGSMRRLGLGYESIEAALIATNESQVNPPLPDLEVRQIAASIMNYAAGNISATNGFSAASPRLASADGLIDFSHIAPEPRIYVLQDLIVAVKVCVLAGLGGVSKTMLSMQLAVCVALGLPYMGKKTLEGAVMLILGEEDAEEISRRFNAIAKKMSLSDEQIALVKARIRAFPMNGLDARLTKKQVGALESTEFTAEVIAASKELTIEAELPVRLIVLDHAGLIHGGEFNSREDVVQTMRQVNFIAQESEAAVMVLAHSPKTAIGKEKADSNDVAGSAAWVDLARAVYVLRTMDEAEGKTFGIGSDMRKNYASLSIVKNNYGPTGGEFWLQRVTVESHSVSVLEHVNLSVPLAPVTGIEALQKRIISIITQHQGKYSRRGFIDAYTGDKSYIKAPKRTIEIALDNIITSGEVTIKPPTDEVRKQWNLHHTVKETLHSKS
ncbi:AAA domain containing protein [Methylophilaceae bacterium]|jgi:hypothetical protein